MARRQQRLDLTQLPEPSDVGRLVLAGARNFAVRNPVVTSIFAFGWIMILTVGTTGIALSKDQYRNYQKALNTIDWQIEYDASQKYYQHNQMYQQSRGGFWPFRTCNTDICRHHEREMNHAKQDVIDIQNESARRLRAAKQTYAGAFSEPAMQEVTDSFWSQFDSAKRYAKRQTMWDTMWMAVRGISRGRDESLIEYGIKILMHLLVNLSMGLLMALVFFIFGLWSITNSYASNPLVAVVFFVACASAAFSFVVTYLLAVYGAAATGVYGVLKVAETSARAQVAGQQRQEYIRPQGHQGQQRPHYD